MRVVAFDAYGTLLDVAAPVEACRDALGDRTGPVADLWRAKQLEYTWLRSLMGRHADFAQVTADALAYALDAFGIGDQAIARRLAAAYETPAPMPDVADMLAGLEGLGLRLCVLSNATPAMLNRALAAAGLAARLDRVFSVEAVGVFKPAPPVYAQVTDAYGIPPGEVAFVSANGWDAAGGAAFGFRVAWINRAGRPLERLPASPAATLTDLRDLPSLLTSWITHSTEA